MVLESLRGAARHLLDIPVLWITGFYLGGLLALVFLLQLQGNQVLGARAVFLGLVALPLFLGGGYGVMHGEGQGIRAYFRAGTKYYARILLAGAIILSAAFLTAFLVLLPLTVAGIAVEAFAPTILLGVIAPIAFFTLFSDTAAVFEDRKVLDSIRRSVEFTLSAPGRVAFFYLTVLALWLLALFISVILWSFVVAEDLLPLVEANQTALQAMTPAALLDMVGPAGLWSGLAIAFAVSLPLGAFLPAFKASFFLRHAQAMGTAFQGEYDEKGRWYRY